MKTPMLLLLCAVLLFACKKEVVTPTKPVTPTLPAPTIASVSPSGGGSGTEVTIKGTHFSDNIYYNVVKFNGIEATVTQVSDSQLVTSVPVGASTGKITVSTNYQTATSTNNFEVYPGQWTFKNVFMGGDARSRSVSFTIDDRAYMTTGLGYNWDNQVWSQKNDCWQFDPVTNRWLQKSELPGLERDHGVGFSVAGKGYVGMGWNNTKGFLKDFWQYDPQTDQWTRMADFPGSSRISAVAFAAGGKAYVGLGTSDFSRPTQELWQYDPSTNQWQQMTNYPDKKSIGAVAMTINERGYVGTGADSSDIHSTAACSNSFYQYDPSTNQWSQKANFPGPARAYGTGFSIGKKAYVGFGVSGLTILHDMWQYDAVADSWSRQADAPTEPKMRLIGFAVGSKGYINGGDPSVQRETWEFNP